MLAPQTNPASPAVFTCQIPKGILVYYLILGVFTIAPSSFPGLPIFLPRCEISQTLETRVYVSIVAGGSVTISILTQYLAVKPSWKDGVSTQFFDDAHSPKTEFLAVVGAHGWIAIARCSGIADIFFAFAGNQTEQTRQAKQSQPSPIKIAIGIST